MSSQVWGKLGQSGQTFGITEGTSQAVGYIKMLAESPSPDHVAQADGTWLIPPEKLDELYKAEMATTDALQLHYNGHVLAEEVEEASRALELYLETRKEIRLKYGKIEGSN